MLINPQSQDQMSVKALCRQVPEEGPTLQAVLLMDTRLPGVCGNIIMFLAFGHTGLRPSIKLKSNRRKGNKKDLNSTITSALLLQEARQKKREKAGSALGEALPLWKNIHPSLRTAPSFLCLVHAPWPCILDRSCC